MTFGADTGSHAVQTASRRVQNAKSAAFHKNITKRGDPSVQTALQEVCASYTCCHCCFVELARMLEVGVATVSSTVSSQTGPGSTSCIAAFLGPL
jgi:hypothetical protein